MYPRPEPDYSTLEVDPNRWIENQPGVAPEARFDASKEEKIHVDTSAGTTSVADQIHHQEALTFCGLRRRTFWISFGVAALVVIGAIAGGVAGGLSTRHSDSNAQTTSPASASPTSTMTAPSSTHAARYNNSGLAALQWKSDDGSSHYRVYYQDSSNAIKESAWDSGSSTWQIHQVSGDSSSVKPATAIAAVAGYPHANLSYTLVKTVYFMSPSNVLFERNGLSNDSSNWEDDNFSGLYNGASGTSLVSYWNQNIKNETQELVVLFQASNFANGLTMGKYISNITSSYPWVSNNFAFSVPASTAFAICPVGSGKDLILYAQDNNDQLVQNEFFLDDSLNWNVISTNSSETGIIFPSNSSITVVSQDNSPSFTQDLFPECAKTHPLTHLILYTSADQSTLNLNTWNCSKGFVNSTAEIAQLLKPDTTYLALASHNDGRIYVMFDPGTGPEIEEWTVPSLSGNAWTGVRNVTTSFH
ncbi:MAG: hypothetical protein M1820_001937 [Bogoriella megaspora]|nr:MAG: hypothetical protein M1820_001937 [Bogoriella megaspora]